VSTGPKLAVMASEMAATVAQRLMLSQAWEAAHTWERRGLATNRGRTSIWSIASSIYTTARTRPLKLASAFGLPWCIQGAGIAAAAQYVDGVHPTRAAHVARFLRLGLCRRELTTYYM